MTFLDWLMKQTRRKDDVGQFAKDTKYHIDIGLKNAPTGGPETEQVGQMYNYLEKRNASDDTLKTLKKAIKEYESDDPYKNTPNVNEQGSLGL